MKMTNQRSAPFVNAATPGLLAAARLRGKSAGVVKRSKVMSTPRVWRPEGIEGDRIWTAGVTTHFQPIFSVRPRAVVGVEALSWSARPDGALVAAHDFLQMAADEGPSRPTEECCRQSAIQSFARLGASANGLLLFLNLDLVAAADSRSVPADLARQVAAAGVASTSVAVKVSAAGLDDLKRFTQVAAGLRARGFLVVLDDVGAGHSNWDLIPAVHPEIIKIDRGLIAGVDGDHHKQATLKRLIGFSRRIGALVVAEGIETCFAAGGLTRATKRIEALVQTRP